MEALQTAEAGRAEEHVAPALEGLGAFAVEDGAGVDLRGDLKGDARGVVRFDDAGDDVHRGTLRREDGVDADGAGHLGEARDGRLDVLRGGHHEVGELVDDEDDVGKLRETFGDGFGVVTGEIADGFFGEDGVAALHLADEPLEGLNGLLRLGDDGVDEVREVAIDGELDDLGVDEDEFEFVGAEAVDQRENEIADTDGFAGAGGAGDEGVGGAGKVEDDVAAGDIYAEDEGEFAGGIAPGVGFEGGAEGEWGGVAVGDFDADETFAGDGRLDADGVGGEGKGEIFFERDDRLDTNAEARFDAELGDAGADDRVVDEGVDRKTVEGVLEDALVGGEFLGAREIFLGGAGGAEEVEGGALIAGEVGRRKRLRRLRS